MVDTRLLDHAGAATRALFRYATRSACYFGKGCSGRRAIPRLIASAASSEREPRASLLKMCSRCDFTVERETNNRLAISRLERCSPTSRTTSSSLGVREAQPVEGRLRSPLPRAAYATASSRESLAPSAHEAVKPSGPRTFLAPAIALSCTSRSEGRRAYPSPVRTDSAAAPSLTASLGLSSAAPRRASSSTEAAKPP